jgi:5-methylcytosine-specific restriction endonuclease McrA
MSQNWRKSYKWRKTKVNCKRKYKRCVICGSLKNREVHHILDASHHPKLRYSNYNTVTLCSICHGDYHTLFLDGYHIETTVEDFFDYIELMRPYTKQMLKERKFKTYATDRYILRKLHT